MHLPFQIRLPAPTHEVARWNNKRWHEHEPSEPWIQRRDSPINSVSSIAVGAVVGVIVILFLAAVIFRAVRSRHPHPKYLPTPFFKRLWTGWNVPASKGAHQPLSDEDHTDDASTLRSSRMRETRAEAGDTGPHGRSRSNTRAANRSSTATTVDRNTSVRSVMTLPAYRQSASNNEQVLGVEGERDGIDTVVELPTTEEEEAQREDEMEALYQIRLARRRQIAEREERRRERREARDRHDFLALDELRTRARVASETGTDEIGGLRQDLEQIKEKRQRAVSSVSYGDLGVARADGTRLRANSTESERVGLLSDAASITLSATSPNSISHQRNRSTSSVLSVDTARSDQPGSPGLGTAGSSTYSIVGRPRSRASSRPETPRAGSARAGSSPEIIEPDVDLADSDMPAHSPPGYDEVSLDDVTPRHSRSTSPYPDPPPNYPGPTRARKERLSAHMADLVAESATEEERQPRQPARGVGGIPQLPSLRLTRLPQIVIEPSSAQPQGGF